tara:strand:- start:1971 stop:2318 length:348 start_codon:yes stop_codon:yes gene_type:complete
MKIVIAIGVVLIGSGALLSYNINTKTEVTTLEVVNKERLLQVSSSDGNSSSSYKNFVYTQDESYIVKDSFWNMHFRSGTVYAKIPDNGGSCDVTLVGMRVGFFSMYQNIIKAECK